jgi:hypothetical protein
LFGGLFNFHVFPHIHFPGPVTFLLIILVIALIVRSNKTPSKK